MRALRALRPSLVQMLLVARPRRMCCSLVCMVMQKARLLLRSVVSPMIRPGTCLRYCFLQANMPRPDPPKSMGFPSARPSPMAMSAPRVPGLLVIPRLSGSIPMMRSMLCSWRVF